jgi:hypothetical protein
VSDDGRSPVQLGDRAQVDCEGQHDLLPLAQAQIGGFDEYACGTQVDGLAQFPAAARDSDVDDGSSTVPRMQAAFHFE